MTPFRTSLALSLILVVLMLAAGCTTTPALDNRTGTLTQTLVSPTTEKPETFYKVTIPQTEGVHPEYIKMDSDVYIQGEIIEFHVVNEGSSPFACDYLPSYNLYRQVGTWELLTKRKSDYSIPGNYWLNSVNSTWGQNSTEIEHVNTLDLIPGHYKISKCGVSREFEIREKPGVTP
jgi:hypothetical protein